MKISCRTSILLGSFSLFAARSHEAGALSRLVNPLEIMRCKHG